MGCGVCLGYISVCGVCFMVCGGCECEVRYVCGVCVSVCVCVGRDSHNHNT